MSLKREKKYIQNVIWKSLPRTLNIKVLLRNYNSKKKKYHDPKQQDFRGALLLTIKFWKSKIKNKEYNFYAFEIELFMIFVLESFLINKCSYLTKIIAMIVNKIISFILLCILWRNWIGIIVKKILCNFVDFFYFFLKIWSWVIQRQFLFLYFLVLMIELFLNAFNLFFNVIIIDFHNTTCFTLADRNSLIGW